MISGTAEIPHHSPKPRSARFEVPETESLDLTQLTTDTRRSLNVNNPLKGR